MPHGLADDAAKGCVVQLGALAASRRTKLGIESVVCAHGRGACPAHRVALGRARHLDEVPPRARRARGAHLPASGRAACLRLKETCRTVLKAAGVWKAHPVPASFAGLRLHLCNLAAGTARGALHVGLRGALPRKIVALGTSRCVGARHALERVEIGGPAPAGRHVLGTKSRRACARCAPHSILVARPVAHCGDVVPGWACLRAVGTDQVRAGQPRARDEPVLPSRALLRGSAARKAAVAAGAVVDGRCAAHALHVLVVRTTPAGCIGAWHAPARVNCSTPSALSDKHVERLAGGEVARRASRRVAQRSTVAESCLVLPGKAERARNAAGGVVGGVASAASLGVVSWRAAKLRLGRAAGDAHPVSNFAPQDARAGDVVSRGAGGAAGAVLKVFLCIYATCERMLLGLQVIIMSTKSTPDKRE